MAHARAVVRSSGSSFVSAMRVLSQDKRDAMFAIYAFCRQVDDIADDPGEETVKRAQLDAWRAEIDALFLGRPTFPIAAALTGPVAAYGLRREDFLAVIAGMEMDAAETLRMADTDELLLYCDRVACAVGRLSNRVFGIDGTAGHELAGALGLALQLTNILRDIHEDALRDRVYLPADLLAAHGIRETDVDSILAHPALPGPCGELADLAQQRFDEAAAIIATCERRAVRPPVIMMKVYHAILRRLLRRGWTRLDQPVRVSKAEKLWIVLRHGLV